MGFSLMGLEPRATGKYLWAGDECVDLDASDLQTWRREGKGLVAKLGESPAVFSWEALKDTVRESVWRIPSATLINKIQPGPTPIDYDALVEPQLPFVRREAFAFGVSNIEGLDLSRVGGFRRELVPGGLRIVDEVLDALEGVAHRIPNPLGPDGKPIVGPDGETTQRVKLIQHLGRIVLDASRATEHEKKV